MQPNTGHCRGLSYTGPRSLPAAGDPPPISEAALAALLAAPLFFFLLGIVVAVPFSGPSPGCCAADASEDFTATASLYLGGVDWVILLASGGPSGSVESVPWLSFPSSDITSGPTWGPPTVLNADGPDRRSGRPRGSLPAVAADASRTLFPSASFTIRSHCASLRGYTVTALITVCAALLSARSKSPASSRSRSGRRIPSEATLSKMRSVARAAFLRALSTHCWTSSSTRTGISSGPQSSATVPIRCVSRRSSFRHPS